MTKVLRRVHAPVALADQVVAWIVLRGGGTLDDVAGALSRRPAEAEAIVKGETYYGR